MDKNQSWLSHLSRLLGKTQVKTKVATKMELEYELPFAYLWALFFTSETVLVR